MYLHNAFEDEQIVPMWVKEGTEGIRARYTIEQVRRQHSLMRQTTDRL